ncbi:hypothetical protein V2G26_000995 [Clonostachys chloroleuca]
MTIATTLFIIEAIFTNASYASECFHIPPGGDHLACRSESHEAMACLSSSQEHDGPQWYPTLWYPIPWDDRIHRLVGRQRPLHMEEAPDGQRRGM